MKRLIQLFLVFIYDIYFAIGVNDCSKSKNNYASVSFLPICDKWRGNFDMSLALQKPA